MNFNNEGNTWEGIPPLSEFASMLSQKNPELFSGKYIYIYYIYFYIYIYIFFYILSISISISIDIYIYIYIFIYMKGNTL